MTADWMEHAACRHPDVDPEWFYAENGNYAPAREVCDRCPLATRTACLEAALVEETGAARYGYRGGLTPEQRHQLTKNRRRGQAYHPHPYTPPLTPEDQQTRRTLYNQGLNDTEIAEATGTTRNAISRWRHREKLPHPGAELAAERATQRERLAALGLTDVQIAAATGVHRRTIAKWRARRLQAAS